MIRGIVIAAIALGAVAAWPFFNAHRSAAAAPYVAPVLPDYAMRDRTIAFYERRVHSAPQDQISAKLLAAQYMQRYRENQDVGDVLRAIHAAEFSVRLQPQNNAGAKAIAASGYTALHRFTTALLLETSAHREQPNDANAPAQMASLKMELGHYAAAAGDLRVAHRLGDTATVLAVQARYDELTGKIDEARRLLDEAIAQSDAVLDNSAQARAWYHFRAGEVAFEAGALDEARAQEHTALAQFPHFEMAYRALARICWGDRDWHCALDAATKGVAILPEPETLGYEADAQRALGDTQGARQTADLIDAVERVGNAYHLNDRLLSVYYAQHGTRLDDALRIAQREVRVRGDEIYAQDTLAWAAAMSHHWNLAERAAARAMRYRTQDPRIEYHAGMIALHYGRVEEARRLLRLALSQNPAFDPMYAERARQTLRELYR